MSDTFESTMNVPIVLRARMHLVHPKSVELKPGAATLKAWFTG
jgi:hypothetical protein